ncbi:esterase-like activity of phytase family protein [Dickeya solani]|uniref:Esterase-like activity of phytase family protein n=1 Tax=Dickeya solani TaxID=1089444 RepID=A0ABU4EKI9_9GAMM|nr:esterase-like activity of phytase family protein [Dickeya solani]MCA6999170.1 esterase-like activity of phytase family protein [Dickeya solani]MCZ0823840.1 esterase-like activity of phytase family protein [Dickeya solani]MDV6997671.1 esterase-like activity of phytase family protein [Dickeya solani]MDV7006535.1 esterase-like activity of phytase family protein [Dickeya solani]MDV7040349.1 esterase-like activity of phytase family protein [Dickeya solani]
MRLRLSFLPMLLLAQVVQAAEIQTEQYQITFPDNDRVSYRGKWQTRFPNGFPMGVGSGLSFIGRDGDKLTFVTVTDRGPNADAPEYQGKDAKIFAAPDFTPSIMTITVNAKSAQATALRKLHDEAGPISGLPLPGSLVGTTNEVALNDGLQKLTDDRRGLDTEGITPDGQGGFWLSDEYGPFLIQVDAQGKILKKVGPTPLNGEQGVASGLPNILKWRQPNRGFEGITRMPDGRILAAVQSTLDIEGKTKNKALLTRLVSFDPATGKTAMYGYPLDADQWQKTGDAKIGDMVALNDHEVLVIEQGADKNKVMRNLIYRVDLSQASDLSALDAKQPAEWNDAKTLAKRGVVLAKKQQLVDLRQLGWKPEKAEGLALIDARTLAVTNDNDFGVQSVLVNPVKGVKKIGKYQVGADGALLLDGKAVDTRLELEPLSNDDAASQLWLIHLPQPLY